jgi:predicted lipoprotein with Yx(FWY)xxD motif
MRNRWWAAAGLAAAAVALTACGSTASTSSGAGSGSAPAAAGSGTTIKTMTTSKGTVLANSAGHTVYWFAIDTSTKSNCNGTCATFWPPVKGTAKAAAGASLTGQFGTITRSDGSTQATYDGHPLYTFKQDTAAGQINGNGLKIEGGLWWAETPSGAKLGAAPQPSSSSSSSGGGYGY